MKLEQFSWLVKQIPYGKKLPTAVYLAPINPSSLPKELVDAIQRAEVAAKPDSAWNLLKLHTDQLAITFLSYPGFENDPHPALVEATRINLNTGTVIRTDYRQRANPPILHRKETFLPPGHPRVTEFAALTLAEEQAGLYRDPSRIGLRLYWHTLLKRLGLSHDGHRLVKLENGSATVASEAEATPEVARHRTAIKRYDLSKPVKTLLERGLLRKQETFFDFGCGHGMDVEALQNLGYQASAGTQHFVRTLKSGRRQWSISDMCLNVIEDPKERLATLKEAFSLAERLLVVSTMIAGQETDSHSRPFGDGFLTKTKTFQKFYAPGELETLIEETLDVEATTLGLGICAAFRDPDEAEAFEANRNRRRIDWTEISAQLRFSAPTARQRGAVGRYELHKELFDEFWRTLLDLGRLPEPGEFERLSDVRRAAGGLKKALPLVVDQKGAELWEHARKTRAEDVLVYLAMTNFRKRFLRREIPVRIKHDIRSLFGDLNVAREKARDLLYAAGDPDEIELACEGLKIGWQDHYALYIHRSLLSKVPAVLRLYVACASLRYGDPEAADIIKLHKRSGKVTFLHYRNFEGDPFPALETRIKVNLRTQFVQVFDHGSVADPQLLVFKERFLAPDSPLRPKAERESRKLAKAGVTPELFGHGPLRSQLHAALGEYNSTLSPMPRFVIQEHHARSHHFDFRLEKDGVFKSWALPKGIPDQPGVRRLAVQVEDHDLAFADFEGEIPKGEYGAGTIRVWDSGEYMPLEWRDDRITFIACGEKAKGRFTMIRFRRAGLREWLLIKNHGQDGLVA